MRRLICSIACAVMCSAGVGAQETSGPGKVVRPRTTDVPDGVKLIGCVQPETQPNAFRLVVSPPAKNQPAAKLPKGLKPGSVVELVARGETNLQPFANQKVEVTGKLTAEGRRLEVLDARPLGVCDTPKVPVATQGG
jgi:hypothetical protein